MTHRPSAPADFGNALKSAASIAQEDKEFEALASLAQCDLTYLQAIQLDRTLQQIDADGLVDYVPLRLAILSSSTVTHLLPPIRVAGFERRLLLDVHETPFGQYRQELLNPESELYRFQPQFLLFSLSARDLLSRIEIKMSRESVEAMVAEYVDELSSLWQAGKNLAGVFQIQQTFLNVFEPVFGNLDRSLAAAPGQVVRLLNDRLVEAAASHGVFVLDLERAVERQGIDFWHDNTRWLQAKMEISPAAAVRYGDLVSRVAAAQRGLSKKCLILDLDNTLWGGIVGDDGIENIVLGAGSALGEAYSAFQRYVKQLNDRGVILAVCSKNEQSTAESVFVEHPEMVLRLQDVALFVANWDDKAQNLIRIARDLNIGIDSLVFVDDNPAERARVRQSLPMVAVPELPQDPSGYVRCLAGSGYFESVTFTAEDVQRADQYSANVKRKNLQVSAESVDDYLISLDMAMYAGPFQDIDMVRVSQLINKTNQFNTTTRRRTLQEIRQLVSEPGNLTLQVRLSDRFGDSGLISAAILCPANAGADTLEIDTWVMSCRVFGRQLEYAIMDRLVRDAKSVNVKVLSGSYIPTPKNSLIANLYSELGFEPAIPHEHGTDGETLWKLDVDNYLNHKTHISVKGT